MILLADPQAAPAAPAPPAPRHTPPPGPPRASRPGPPPRPPPLPFFCPLRLTLLQLPLQDPGGPGGHEGGRSGRRARGQPCRHPHAALRGASGGALAGHQQHNVLWGGRRIVHGRCCTPVMLHCRIDVTGTAVNAAMLYLVEWCERSSTAQGFQAYCPPTE